MENVILVNAQDQELGLMEKMEAHRQGLLHRAFSVFVFNDHNELLIHQRAAHKYHSKNLWTNTCCSHPRQHETVIEAAHRRLQEEMGFDCELSSQFSFIYQAELEDGLSEHELDHVLIGKWNGIPPFNVEEVQNYRYISLDNLEREIASHPEHFTVWFKIALPQVLERIKNTAA
ncbi:MAG: isopentenyl-diphosphate Delta-isomerase [Flavobacteriales bacterium]